MWKATHSDLSHIFVYSTHMHACAFVCESLTSLMYSAAFPVILVFSFNRGVCIEEKQEGGWFHPSTR